MDNITSMYNFLNSDERRRAGLVLRSFRYDPSDNIVNFCYMVYDDRDYFDGKAMIRTTVTDVQYKSDIFYVNALPYCNQENTFLEIRHFRQYNPFGIALLDVKMQYLEYYWANKALYIVPKEHEINLNLLPDVKQIIYEECDFQYMKNYGVKNVPS